MTMFTKSKATREKVTLMVGFSGPSGAGKTWSALQVAYGITGDWSKITVIDTENKSALYYADRMEFGPFEHIPFPPSVNGGYDPRNYIKAIEFAESDPNCEAIVIDSASHEWEGVGGCLDMVDRINKGFAGWKTITPLHAGFIDKMRHSRCHILATMRTKSDYIVEQKNGKMAPKKVGLKANQREGTDYEFGIVFDIEISHFATATKDRTGLFMGRGPVTLTADHGKELLKWANSGADTPETTQTASPEGQLQESVAPQAPTEAGAYTANQANGGGERKSSIFTGATEQQEAIAIALRNKKIPEYLWSDISDRLMGKPGNQLNTAIAAAKSAANANGAPQ